MKKFTTLLLASAVLLGFISCNNKDDNPGGGIGRTLSGTIADMPQAAGAMTLKVTADVEASSDDVVLTECSVAANGSFTLELPETVPANCLVAYSESDIEFGGMPGMEDDKWLTVSNKDAKICPVDFKLYDGEEYIDDNIIYGHIQLVLGMPTAVSQAAYIYADSPFTISGTTEATIDDIDPEELPIPVDAMKVKVNVNLSLAKGWNVMVAHIAISVTATELVVTMTADNNVPAESKWMFESNMDIFDF